MKKVAAMLALLLLLALLGCAGSPASAIGGFFSAAGHGEIDDAMGYLSARLLQMGNDKLRAALVKFAQDSAAKGGLKSVAVEQLQVNGQIANAVAVLTYGNGTVSHENVTLIQEDHRWKLDFKK